MSNTTNPIKPVLVIEKWEGAIWGRVKIKGNLIINSASSLDKLTKKMTSLIFEFEHLKVDGFVISYDLGSFFEHYSFINIAEIAHQSGIAYGLMRQYAVGNKFPSAERVKKIEQAIRDIGKKLSRVKLHKSKAGIKSLEG